MLLVCRPVMMREEDVKSANDRQCGSHGLGGSEMQGFPKARGSVLELLLAEQMLSAMYASVQQG